MGDEPQLFLNETLSGHFPAELDSGGEGLQGHISEADLRRVVEQGGAIRRVVVVTLGANREYLAYLKFSDRKGYSRLAMRKYEAAKAYRDFRILQRVLAEHGYTGPVYVYPDGHPFLQRITG